MLGECTLGLYHLLTSEGIGGYVEVHDNAPGCNSVDEILAGGPVSADEVTPLVAGLAPAYPNPMAGAATVAFTLAEPADVRLAVYDMLGRRVRTLAEGPQSAGEHEVTLDAGLAAGAYIVRFEAGPEAWSQRVTVVQ